MFISEVSVLLEDWVGMGWEAFFIKKNVLWNKFQKSHGLLG